MTNQDISELIALFDRSTAQSMRLRQGDFSLELDRGAGEPAPASRPSGCGETAAAVPKRAEPVGAYLRAPLVGTYYAAPEPGKPPFVRPGDRIPAGQTVCLIEAMKMMSEVAAPCDCVVEELLQENGALLAYDAPILRYREA